MLHKIEKRKISFADDLEQALKWKEVTFAIKCLIVCPVNVKRRIMLKMIANREILGEKCLFIARFKRNI